MCWGALEILKEGCKVMWILWQLDNSHCPGETMLHRGKHDSWGPGRVRLQHSRYDLSASLSLAICRNKHTLWEIESIIFHKESIFVNVCISKRVQAWFTVCLFMNNKRMTSPLTEEKNSWPHHAPLNRFCQVTGQLWSRAGDMLAKPPERS